jgi:hypothetical protein
VRSLFLVLADLEEVAKTGGIGDEYPEIFHICYYERFWNYGLVL